MANTSSYIRVGRENSTDIELYYQDLGSGEPVILIHGWPLSSASWEAQIDVLVAAGYRVIAYDRRGFGKSSQPSGGYDYDTLTDDLNRIVTTLGLDRFALVGFSMGGGEVARYIGRYGSSKVSKAVFISAVPPYLLQDDSNPDGAPQSVYDDIQAGLRKDRPGFLKGIMHKFFTNPALDEPLVSDALIQAAWAVAVGASRIATIETVQQWHKDFRDDIRQFEIPTLIIHGDADEMVPAEISGKKTHEMIAGSKYVNIPGGPHGVPSTHADLVNKALIDFLGS